MAQQNAIDRVGTVRNELIARARMGPGAENPTYREVGDLIGLAPRSQRLYRVLDLVCCQEHHAGRPLLAALVVKEGTDCPGPGFFETARDLGLYNGNGRRKDREFWQAEVARVHAYWAPAP